MTVHLAASKLGMAHWLCRSISAHVGQHHKRSMATTATEHEHNGINKQHIGLMVLHAAFVVFVNRVG